MNKENKILLFIKLPPPFTGATLMNSYVNSNTLLKQNYSVKTISIHYSKSVNEFGGFAIKKIVKVIGVYLKLFLNLIYFRPKVVYFQISPLGGAFIRDLFFVSLIKIFRTNIIYHLHGMGIKEVSEKSKSKKRLYQYAFHKEYVICLSELLIDDIKGVYYDKPFIVNNGIKYIDPHTKSKKRDLPTILFLSNLFKRKGIFVFLDALEQLNARGISFKGIIVGEEGDISDVSLLTEIAIRNLKPYVFYYGGKYNEEKNKIWEQTDIFVFPSLIDVWGLVVLEAMQFSIPVVSTKVGAIPDIIDDGKTGFVVNPNDPFMLADKIELLINNPLLSEQMGAAGRKKFLEKYTLEIFEKNLYNVFQHVFEANNNK